MSMNIIAICIIQVEPQLWTTTFILFKLQLHIVQMTTLCSLEYNLLVQISTKLVHAQAHRIASSFGD